MVDLNLSYQNTVGWKPDSHLTVAWQWSLTVTITSRYINPRITSGMTPSLTWQQGTPCQRRSGPNDQSNAQTVEDDLQNKRQLSV